MGKPFIIILLSFTNDFIVHLISFYPGNKTIFNQMSEFANARSFDTIFYESYDRSDDALP